MNALVKLVLLLFTFIFLIKMSWIWWPVIFTGAGALYIAYLYAQADELERINIKSCLDELPHIFERLFV